ncbi:hypothetical protein [Allokutzneria oryzae]|uniref:SH3 domain-containing protein n=1 Tax=Allokutzneria oryzae TaxID=1378989 RepID=A0ABV6A9Z4_9PSEU
MRNSRKWAATVLPLMITSAVLAVAPSASAAPAGAAACTSHRWSAKDSNWGTTKDNTGGPIRSGPHSSCSVVIWPTIHTKLFYHCYVRNEAGNTWTHVRPDQPNGTTLQGWVYDGNLDDGGSLKPC